jgi:hypothetical protein
MSILVENKHTIEDFTDCQNIKDFRDYFDIWEAHYVSYGLSAHLASIAFTSGNNNYWMGFLSDKEHQDRVAQQDVCGGFSGETST